MTVFPIHYFPSISYYIHLLNSEKYIFEKEENFTKQSYRSRAHILGANGKLALNIPIKHKNTSRKYKDTLIADEENWKRIHIQSIKSAYQSSPFFEYYEDQLLSVFTKNHKYLYDFNLECFTTCNTILKLPLEIQETQEYLNNDKYLLDYRELLSPKKESKIITNPYIQVFSPKLGFTPDLSIIDLICNEGTRALDYLQTNKTKI